MSITHVQAAEAQQRRHAATTPDRPVGTVPAPQQRAAPLPAGLTTASLGATRGRSAAPEYGSGQIFAAGGNRLRGRHHDPAPGEATGTTVTWFVPPNGRLDPGDGTELVEVGALGGEVVHVYDDPPAGTVQYIVDARCLDPYDRLIGWCKFRLPHHATDGIAIEGISANRVPMP
jgi:hypothetical protein